MCEIFLSLMFNGNKVKHLKVIIIKPDPELFCRVN